jgi:type II secretory pathway pseudopilin PulG
MPTRLSLRLAEVLITATLAIAVLAAWRADRRDRAQLAAQLAAAKQTLEQADARQHERDAQLVQTLASLAAEKRAVTTPAQIVRDLPKQIALPAPITLQSSNSTTASGKATCSSGPGCGPEGLDSTQFGRSPGANLSDTNAVIPAEDLKPLYDFALDCKACQSKLAAAQGDLADERAKSAVLTRERDAAIRAAKGGSVLRRITRAAKGLAIGAAAGAIAAQARR